MWRRVGEGTPTSVPGTDPYVWIERVCGVTTSATAAWLSGDQRRTSPSFTRVASFAIRESVSNRHAAISPGALGCRRAARCSRIPGHPDAL